MAIKSDFLFDAFAAAADRDTSPSARALRESAYAEALELSTATEKYDLVLDVLSALNPSKDLLKKKASLSASFSLNALTAEEKLGAAVKFVDGLLARYKGRPVNDVIFSLQLLSRINKPDVAPPPTLQ